MSWLLISSIVLLSSRLPVAAIANGVASSSLTGGMLAEDQTSELKVVWAAPFLNALATITSVTWLGSKKRPTYGKFRAFRYHPIAP